MKYIMAILSNQVFLSAVAGWLLAQIIKITIEIIKGDFTIKRLSGGGGMPSSHSATVTGLLVATGIVEGLESTSFAIALFFAIIVMYDAMGVRYQTGLEGKILNAYRKRDLAEGKKPLFDQELEEKMGHTLFEIIAGVLVGIFAAILVWMIIGK